MYADLPVPVGPTTRTDFWFRISMSKSEVNRMVSNVSTIISLKKESFGIGGMVANWYDHGSQY